MEQKLTTYNIYHKTYKLHKGTMANITCKAIIASKPLLLLL